MSLGCTALLEYNNEMTGSFVSRVETLYSAMYMIVYIVQQTLDKESMCAREAHVEEANTYPSQQGNCIRDIHKVCPMVLIS